MVVFPKGEAGAGTANALFSRYLKSTVLSGAAANTNIALSGIDPRTDELISVIEERNGLKLTSIAGVASAGNHTVTGIATEDRIVAVQLLTTTASIATHADLTAEFTITAANTINNTGGTNTGTGNTLLVWWEDVSTSRIDRTAIASISSYGNIRLTSSTAGSKLSVIYTKRGVR